MPEPLRHVAAIRKRLINDPALLSLLQNDNRRVYVRSIRGVTDPKYPLITIWQRTGNQAVWSVKLFDPTHIIIQIYSQKDEDEAYRIQEQTRLLLHTQDLNVSTTECCFHEIREDWSNSAIWDPDTAAWVVAMRYLVRASVL
ncbi:MAG: hypothetical protein ACRDGM_11200 [bacterium]